MSTVQSGHAIRELNQIIGIARDGHDITPEPSPTGRRIRS
jgi:hypothetical protein